MKFTISVEGFPTDTFEVSELDGEPIAKVIERKAREVACDKYKQKHLRKDGVPLGGPFTPVIEVA